MFRLCSRLTPIHALLSGLIVVAVGLAAASPAGAVGLTERVSVASDGAQANGAQPRGRRSPPTAATSRSSRATNLVAGDTNGVDDVFVRDRQTGATERVSVDSAGAQGERRQRSAPAISADGRYVAFESSRDEPRRRATPTAPPTSSCATARPARPSASASAAPGRRANGRQPHSRRSAPTAATSRSSPSRTNLVAGDTNGVERRLRPRPPDRHDRAGQRRAAAARRGTASASTPAICADGRYVAFELRRDEPRRRRHQRLQRRLRPRPPTGTTERVSVATGGAQANGDSFEPGDQRRRPLRRLRADATNLVAGDTNGVADVFVRDRRGRHDRAGQRRHAAAARRTAPAATPAISADGRYVAFDTAATNLVAGRHERRPRRLPPRPAGRHHGARQRRHQAGPEPQQLHGRDQRDGPSVAFHSQAPNLVAGDTNAPLRRLRSRPRGSG